MHYKSACMHEIPCLDLWHNVLDCTGTFSMKTPFSILNMPGKRTHMRHLQQKARMLKMQVQRVTARLEKLQEESTVATEEDLSGDLIVIMIDGEKDIQKLSATSFTSSSQAHVYARKLSPMSSSVSVSLNLVTLSSMLSKQREMETEPFFMYFFFNFVTT